MVAACQGDAAHYGAGENLEGNECYKDSAPTELRQPPDAAADVLQESGIAQDLELLADFVADVAVDAKSTV